jgi:formyl-CoA transferase
VDAETPQPFGALAGLKIVDLSRILAGPFCTQMLGDHGAEVIKVEPPDGDGTRSWGPPFKDGQSAYFSGVNRNKESLALNLRGKDGHAVLFRLLEDADVLIENFKAGQMERWGLGYEQCLRARFPRLIYAQITGYGTDGPMAGMPGFDAVAQVMSGLASINGTADGPPVRMGVPISDLATGLYTAIALLMALQERERSGLGQKVEVSLLECSVSLLHPHGANYLMSGEPPARTGNAHPNIAPYDMFATRTAMVFAAIGNDKQFVRFAEELGAPELAEDTRFRSNSDRVVNRDALRAALEPLLAETDGMKLCEHLLSQNIPAGPVLDIPQVLSHAQVEARDMLVERGSYRGIATPIKMSRTPGSAGRPPPRLSEHARQVLAEAGYGEDEIERMIRGGVVSKPVPAA